jgi:clan AA aspartic protease (TIGR02281 family)
VRTLYSILLVLSLALNGYLYLRHEQLLEQLDSHRSNHPVARSERAREDRNNLHSAVDEMLRRLQNGHYLQAIALIVERELAEANDFIALQARARDFIARQLKRGELSAAGQLIDTFLASYPDEMAILALNISLHELRGDLSEAIRLAYDAQYLTFDINLKADRVTAARELSQRVINQSLHRSDWSQMAQLCSLVLSLDSEFAHAQWHLARAQFEQRAWAAANSGASALLDNPQWREAAERLLIKIEQRRQQATEISMLAYGDQYTVEAMISSSMPVSLLVDTGASICTLSQSMFKAIESQIDATFLKDIQLRTAGGTVTAQLYRISSLSLGEYRVSDLEIAINPHSGDNFDGLLGMNFLSMFTFAIDQRNHRLRLSPK